MVKDLVLSGTSGGDEGARGFVDAYKASTGERAWRFWNMPAPGEPLSETWVGRVMESQHGCVDGWLTGTYDPSTDLIYWPTGNPCPDYNGDERKGDNLYSSSVLALEPETGKLRWHFQFSPHDLHDWDATETPMLIDAEFRGRPRKLLVQANRNGFFYVLDRVTGEFLLANLSSRNSPGPAASDRTAGPSWCPARNRSEQGTRTCPSVAGATNWMSTAYNPATEAVLRDGAGILQHLHEVVRVVASRDSRSTAARRAESLARSTRNSCGPSIYRPARSSGRFRKSDRAAAGGACSRRPEA